MSKAKNFSTSEPCTACLKVTENGNTFHHVKTRGAGGSNHPENMMPLCQSHHALVHSSIGLQGFVNLHPRVHEWMLRNNWYQNFDGKWFNENSVAKRKKGLYAECIQ
jgi:hypothetical protein